MCSYGVDYQPTNTPKDDFHQQLLNCDKVFSALVRTVQDLETQLTPNRGVEEMSKDLRAKFETLKGACSIYTAVRDLLQAKNMAIQTTYDLSQDGSAKKRELNQVYVKMKEVLAIMEVRLLRLLGLPNTWFGLRYAYISSWTAENPKKALGLVAAGGALLGGFAGFFHAMDTPFSIVSTISSQVVLVVVPSGVWPQARPVVRWQELSQWRWSSLPCTNSARTSTTAQLLSKVILKRSWTWLKGSRKCQMLSSPISSMQFALMAMATFLMITKTACV